MILALDLGTRTGWAAGSVVGITSGYIDLKGGRFEGGGMRFLRFQQWLNGFAKPSEPLGAVYYEEVRRHLGTDAAHIYGGLQATLTSWCEAHKVPYEGIPVGTIKKHATGKGNAGKDEMIAAARKISGFGIADDNEADAVCLLDYVCARNVLD